MEADDPTSVFSSDFVSSMENNILGNVITIGGIALLWGLKKLCSRDQKCKSRCHTCCLDVEVADRRGNTLRGAAVPVDLTRGSPV